jgi:transcriptional regulator with GAF, ATPase, and Fis domain
LEESDPRAADEHLAIVARSGEELAASATLDEGFERAMRLLEEPLGARRAALILAEGEPPALVVEVGHGMAAGALRPRYGGGVAGRVVESGLPMVVADLDLEPAALFELAEPDAWKNERLALVSVPVVMAGRCAGALSVYLADQTPSDLPIRRGIVQVLAAFLAQRLRQDRLSATAPTLALAVERVERRMIENALRASPGNLAKASRALGTTERILRYKLTKYGLLGLRRRTPPRSSE